jgi:hypothetical protein
MTQSQNQVIISPWLYEVRKAEGQEGQLALFCGCGRRQIELKSLGCCRLCYHRNYHSLRWFGGLRELILTRDRFRCRGCRATRRLIVHHRDGRNVEPVLITLCIRCHVRLHRARCLRGWIPEALLELWSELHPDAPLQFQLPLKKPATDEQGPIEPHWRNPNRKHMPIAQLAFAMGVEATASS